MSAVLESTAQEHLALTLSNDYFEQLQKDKDYNRLVPLLTRARDTVWPDSLPRPSASPDAARQRQGEIESILKEIGSDEDKIRFMEAFAKLGHLYEMGGHLARSNYFGGVIAQGKNIPHGAADFADTMPTAKEAVAALNRPIFEMTFTSHPTNNNTLELMNALREVGESATLQRGRNTPENKLRCDEAMRAFAAAPLLPMKDGKDTNISVSGETKEMLNFMGNAYHDLAAAYRHFDRALEKKGDYDPLALHLQVRFNSWGSSGDKDGNKKVNADTTLESAFMHTLKVTQLVAADIAAMPSAPLKDFGDSLEKTAQGLVAAREEIKGYRKRKEPLPQEAFDRLSARLSELTPDMEAVRTAALDAYKARTGTKSETEENEKRSLLMLARKIEVFGPHMGKLEYRETSEEFTRVVALVLNGQHPPIAYPVDGKDTTDEQKTANEAERVRILTKLIDEGKAPEMLAKVRAYIDAEGTGQNFAANPYAKDEAIAYHTLKRLELARDHPGLVANQVLAECQGLSNKLEVKLLMEGLEKDGRKPVLGIVPLYEDPEVMQKVGAIERQSYANPVYRKHLDEVAKAHPQETQEGKPTQQVQFAHSDNGRRGGKASAVGFIDEGHRDFRAAAQEAGVVARSYEGGSQSDPFRGGGRSFTAMSSGYGSWDFFKSTVQGGDLHNYFGTSSSTERLITRGMAHGAKHYDDAKPALNLASDPINFLAVKALEATLADYESSIFKTDKIGVVLAAVGFGRQEMNGGNTGTRSQRDPGAVFPPEGAQVPIGETKRGIGFKAVKSVHMGAANPDAIRTISYAELLEHAGLYPTWLGTRTIEENVRKFSGEALEKLVEKSKAAPLSKDEREMQTLLSRAAKTESGGLAAAPSPRLLQTLYSKSAAFREVIDRMAFGVAMSNLDAAETLQPQLKGTQIMEQLKAEYVTAGRLALKAMGGEARAPRTGGGAVTPEAAVQQAVSSHLEHLMPTIERKRNYMEFVNRFKRDWKDNHPPEAGETERDAPLHLLRLCHAALDTATHGRNFMADDPRYAEAVTGKALAGQARNGAAR